MLFSQQLTHLVLLKAAWAHNPRGITDVPGAARALVRRSSLELPQKRNAHLALFHQDLNEQVLMANTHLLINSLIIALDSFLPSVADKY